MARERKKWGRERERVWVDRRLTIFERRQKLNPEGASSRWIRKEPVRGGSNCVPRSEFDLLGDKAVSFFFWNFPPDCDVKTLWKKFAELGRIVDLFCPKKRDKAGRQFGFVRFLGNHYRNNAEFLQNLNSIWVGSYKLRVFVPKYNRNETKTENKIHNRPFSIPKTSGVRECSFAEVLTNKVPGNREQEEASLKEKVLQFKTDEGESSWLGKCGVALLKRGVSWEEYGGGYPE